jgi:hypothetical protein
MNYRCTGIAVWICTVAACQTYGNGEDVPARIDEPTALSRAALQATVNRALGTEVLLSVDALTESSVLTIEQRQPGTMENPLPQGRVMDMPTNFRLVKRGGTCFLIDTRSETSYRLKDTNCVPE